MINDQYFGQTICPDFVDIITIYTDHECAVKDYKAYKSSDYERPILHTSVLINLKALTTDNAQIFAGQNLLHVTGSERSVHNVSYIDYLS